MIGLRRVPSGFGHMVFLQALAMGFIEADLVGEVMQPACHSGGTWLASRAPLVAGPSDVPIVMVALAGHGNTGCRN